MRRFKRVRPILQMEATECGAASLAMILDYYGKTVTLEELRQECGVSRNGVTAGNIVRAAIYHGLKPRAVRVELDSVKKLKLPAIIHWNMDHFLVLCGFHRNSVLLADPACGRRTVSLSEFSKSFTGIAIELTPTEAFETNMRKGRGAEYISSCLKAVLPSAAYFLLLELCAVIASAAVIFLGSVFVDTILIGANSHNLMMILRILLCAGSIGVATMLLFESVSHRVGKQLNTQINFGLIEHLLKLPIGFYAQRSEGDLTNRQNAAMCLGNRLSRLLSPVPGYLLQILVYFLLIFLFDAYIALIGVVCAGVNIAAMLFGARKYEEKMRSYSRDTGVLQGDISRSIDLIETLKSCGAEDAIFSRLTAAGTQMLNTKTDIDKTGIYTNVLFGFLNTLGTGAVLIAGTWEILSGRMSIGILVAAQALVSAMLSPIGKAVDTGLELQTLRGESARVNDIMNYREDDSFLDESAVQTRSMDWDIEFHDVSYSFSPLEAPFIQNFDLTIQKGGSVAITGASGSGKSTIAKILAGLYRESGGVVCFGGASRKEIDRYYFYTKTAVVSQNIRLFEGTVLDNITMWDSSISYDDAVAAAKAACIHEDIIRRKNGYREMVTENGRNFSGGQRQRIEIARALAKKPSIIIMDEATSALDADTEAQIMGNIASMGITRVIVAHRLSTIMDSDEILVISNGKVAERGTHSELMSRRGEYFELVRGMG